jgi:hypothetical protein
MSLAGSGLVKKSSPYWELRPIGNFSPNFAIAFLNEREGVREVEGDEQKRKRAHFRTCISDAKMDLPVESPFITAIWRDFVRTLAAKSWIQRKVQTSTGPVRGRK